VGRGGGRHVPPKIRGKYFSGNYYVKIPAFSGRNNVKFGNFVNFSGKNHVIFGHFVNFFRAKMSCPTKVD